MSIEASYEASLKAHYASVLRRSQGRKIAVVKMPAKFWQSIISLRPLVIEKPKRLYPCTLEGIRAAVCDHLNISREDFESLRRQPAIVRARHLYFWFARKHTTASFPMIGRHCGNRDHSTVWHGVEKIESNMADYATDIENISEMLA